MIRRTVLFGFSLLLILTGYAAILFRFEALQYDFYLLEWWGYIFLLKALPDPGGIDRPALPLGLIALAVVSCGFWSLFELINLRMNNWFYINLPQGLIHRHTGYLLAYGTVIPGMLLTARRIERVLGGLRGRPLSVRGYPAKATAAGIAMLVLTLLFPQQLFPLAWLFLLPLVDGLSHRLGYRSIMGDLERGRWKALLSSVLSGLACGFLWEFWNFWALSKWVYSVPGFEGWKLFEMPLAGYLGFAFFGLETLAFARFIEGAVKGPRAAALFVAAGLAISLATFPLIDRHTVGSYAPRLRELTLLSEGTKERLHAQGVRTSFGIDPGTLTGEERQLLALVHLKGLGMPRAQRLFDRGIVTARQLAELDELEAASILAEQDPRRVRVYLKAAQTEPTR